MKLLKWLLVSSENPNNVSMTVKGALKTIVSIVLLLSPLLHFKTDEGTLQSIATAIGDVIVAFFAFVSSIEMVVGFLRKLHLSGKNPTELQTNPLPTKIGDSPVIEDTPTPVMVVEDLIPPQP